nr:coiled-coil domain-containing protein 68 isoform X1 [Pogona vitticeps]XP_020655943.1 coiled-coil domain-containing protein 68 isoform X1 [Pogona vitticeps]XP_020655944.1 coiled-coil domain-containing protein 68 isoform X1 [Pogona vitticeps]XP_020655945.1 coiled-coil domain-containing protein 68 isoform X1 [Pogona vitticeps]XP_020655946.1 coiled-coil domain-containing protein 68 isoform X1 [Pogona vitticeps]XP_020655947.1 coiled-coil domain-containing protein 68 isoform X1 [Pogona vitticeps]
MSQKETNCPPIKIMTTTLIVTQHVVRENQGTKGNDLLYGTTAAEINEETEYIKKIRATLAKVQPLLGKSQSSHWIANGQQETKPHLQEPGVESDKEPTSFDCKETMKKMKEAEEELLRVNQEKEMLKIKLEASRAAGAESVKNASEKLHEDYQKRLGELKKRQEGIMQVMKAHKLKQEQKLKESTDNLIPLNGELLEKLIETEEMEKRVQRMEEEKKKLNYKKRALKETLQQMMSKAENTKRCVGVQTEISTLQEQISHLDRLIHSQHQNLHSLIYQIEELNNELKHQDENIDLLKEKLEMLQAKNKELKYKVEFYSSQSKPKVSKAVSAKIDGYLPYAMINRLRR